METKLTIQERLKDLRVVDRGLSLEQLTEQTGLSKSALGKYESEDFKDISPFAIVTLTKFYGESTYYLLGLTETRNHSNANLHDLHLSDDMIATLKSGKINNRLLCEMVTHKEFQRLMVDIEIYIDRIADMRINDLNAVLDAVRPTVMDKKNPRDNDLYIRTLELAQVNVDEYFSHVIHKDMNRIVRDIRETHKADTTTADVASPASETQKKLREVMSFEGSDDEKKVRAFLVTYGIDYNALTMDEFVTLINILKKSKYMKIPYNQRCKGNRRRKKHLQ